jgi:hypothetical protein
VGLFVASRATVSAAAAMAFRSARTGGRWRWVIIRPDGGCPFSRIDEQLPLARIVVPPSL